MTNCYITRNNYLEELTGPEPGCWVNLVAPTESEINRISNKYNLDIDALKAALDADERSRIELEDNYTMILVNIPCLETETETKAFILKLDSNLEEIYLKKFGKAADNFLFDLQVKDNSLIAVGAVNTIEEYAFDYYYWQSSKGWILKIDSETGIVLNDFYSDKVSCFNSITKTEDDGFVLSAIKNVDKSNLYSFDTLIVKANENLEF